MRVMRGLGLLLALVLEGIVVERGVLAAALQPVAQGRPHVQSHDGVVHAVLVLVRGVLGGLRDGLGDGVGVEPRHFVVILLLLSLAVCSVVFVRRHRQKEPEEMKNNMELSPKGLSST